MKIDSLEEFIDRNLKCKMVINKETDEEYYEKYVFLREIDKLNVTDEEVDFIFKYLEKQGITVYGSHQCYVGVYDNYKLKSKLYYYGKQNDKINNEAKMLEYQKTKDIRIRNEIVEANIKLVNYLSYKYGKCFKISRSILDSYGYEGLIKAIDSFDFSKGKFNSHIFSYTRNYILNGVVFEKLGTHGFNWIKSLKSENEEINHFALVNLLNAIEIGCGITLKDNPNMIELVINKLKESSDYSPKLLKDIKTGMSINNPYSLDQLSSQLVYSDDSSLYNNSVEKVFQEELGGMLIKFIGELEKEQYKDILINHMLNDETLQHIGKRYGATRQSVFIVKKRALKELGNKLRSYKNKEIVNSFLENINHEYGDVKRAYIKKK